MDREPKTPPLQSWQLFSAGIFHLKKDTIARLFGVSPRQVERWAANPDTTESHQRNPLDRIEAMVRGFMGVGQVETAQIMAARLACIAGCELQDMEPAWPDKPTVQHECLDDYPPLTRFHEAVSAAAGIEEVRHLWQACKREIDETFELYLRGASDGSMSKKQAGQRD